MENLGDYERTFIDRLFVEYHELFKQKIDLTAKLIVTEKTADNLNRDLHDLANKFHQLKSMYDSVVLENEQLKNVQIQVEETVKSKKGAK